MGAAKIKTFVRVEPKIYAYKTPGVTYHEDWIKIGYTDKQTVEERVRQQTHTAGVRAEIQWDELARYTKDPKEFFTDRNFHRFLTQHLGVEREEGTEWFKLDAQTSHEHFFDFAARKYAVPTEDKLEYELRREQGDAVTATCAYFGGGGQEFLWNAKPRFGKTLTAYDLVQAMGFSKVLIVTNRPSIANSWADDFFKFVGWRGEYVFVSENDALKGRPGVYTRDEYIKMGEDAPRGMIAFESLQGLKGSRFFGGEYRKLEWMAKEYVDIYGNRQEGVEFDLLIVDESHEGVETMKTERAFQNIKRKHTLYLSGTPFKQLASAQFSGDQIYNWSYADEQEAKAKWEGEAYNPYETLPRLAMFTYRLSDMIRERIERGIDLSGEDDTTDYAFDLNEFFATDEKGKFLHEEDIKKFLHALTTQEKYPFSTPELRQELCHTMWYLDRVNSAKALAKLLAEDEVFRDYHVVVAAGDGKTEPDDEQEGRAIDRVRAAIAEHEKTITLTVGQLTVGVTIPEWSGVLMLCNMKSPSSYMQAAFRAQNPCTYTRDGERYQKDTAYVFDFDPARTLIIFDDFANNLSSGTVGGRGTSEERKENIKRLLNFFPVLGEDDEGKMVELDATQVLSIPRKLKSQEVVRHGFMSNFLFQNISNIFGAPGIVKNILEQIAPAQEEKGKRDKPLDRIDGVHLDENGEIEIPNETVIGIAQDLFGPKVYETIGQAVKEKVDALCSTADAENAEEQISELKQTMKESLKELIVAPAVQNAGVKKSAQNMLEREVEKEIDQTFRQAWGDFSYEKRMAQEVLDRKLEQAATEQEVQSAKEEHDNQMSEAWQTLTTTIQANVEKTIEDKPTEVVEKIEKYKAEEEKHTIEEDIRSHLRGFARTIPSFIMVYGDEGLTLANFDEYTEDDVFFEVTGITEDQFRFLRDGGDYEEDGQTKHFEGKLFDEVVFNDSIQEFWKKKQQLADYFNEESEEDIFDYIPPQKTNQIFTPRRVVSMMVDKLEENNPGCFDDPDKTFADLYMKSGLYITEIVKRLYRSEGLKAAFPDDKERIRHILQKQVYGMAPTRIIYLIAKNYILGFDEELKGESHNFVEADAAEAAKQGKLQELVDQYFGE